MNLSLQIPAGVRKRRKNEFRANILLGKFFFEKSGINLNQMFLFEAKETVFGNNNMIHHFNPHHLACLY